MKGGKSFWNLIFLFLILGVNNFSLAYNLQYRDGIIVRDFARENSNEEIRSNYIEFLEHLPEWNPKIYIRNEQNNLGLITKTDISSGSVILTNRYPNSLNSLDILFVKHFSEVVKDFQAVPQIIAAKSDFYLSILYLLAEKQHLDKFENLWLFYELHQLQLNKPIELWDDLVALNFLEGSCLLSAVRQEQEIDKFVFEYFQQIFARHPTVFSTEITFTDFSQIKALVQKKFYVYSTIISELPNQKTITMNNACLFGGIDIAKHVNDVSKVNAEVRIICPDNSTPFICSGSLVALRDIAENEEIFITRSFDHNMQIQLYIPTELYRLYSIVDFEYVSSDVTLMCDIENYFTKEEGTTLGEVLEYSGLYPKFDSYLDLTYLTKSSISLHFIRLARSKSLDRDLTHEDVDQIFNVLNGTSIAFSITSELKAIYKAGKALQKRLAQYEPIIITDLGGSTPIYQQIALWLRSQEISILQANLQFLEQYWNDFLFHNSDMQ